MSFFSLPLRLLLFCPYLSFVTFPVVSLPSFMFLFVFVPSESACQLYVCVNVCFCFCMCVRVWDADTALLSTTSSLCLRPITGPPSVSVSPISTLNYSSLSTTTWSGTVSCCPPLPPPQAIIYTRGRSSTPNAYLYREGVHRCPRLMRLSQHGD